MIERTGKAMMARRKRLGDITPLASLMDVTTVIALSVYKVIHLYEILVPGGGEASSTFVAAVLYPLY